MSGGGWYKRGDEIKDEDFKTSNQIYRKIPEFWIKEGKDNGRNVLFLDDPNFLVMRIMLKVGDDFVSFTSLGEECPAVAKGYNPTACLVHTVLDLTPYKDKKGVEKKYFKKIYLVKGKDSRDRMEERRSNAGGSIQGIKMKIMRLGEKSPNSGNDLQVLGRIDLSKMNIPADDLKPLDYMDLLAPPTRAQIEAVLKYAAPPNGKKSKTVSRDSLAETDPFATEASQGQPGPGVEAGDPGNIANGDFAPEPEFGNADEIPF